MIATDLLEIGGLGGCTGASPFTMEGVLPVINNRPCTITLLGGGSLSYHLRGWEGEKFKIRC